MDDPLKVIRDRCDEVGDCWLWKQSRSTSGYGRAHIPRLPQYAHKAAWFIVHGTAPRLANKCGNSHCCNVEHWTLMTPKLHAIKSGASGTSPNNPQRIARISITMRRAGKLDAEKVATIRLRQKPAKDYAAEFNVDVSQIYRIWKGDAWREAAPNSSVFNMVA